VRGVRDGSAFGMHRQQRRSFRPPMDALASGTLQERLGCLFLDSGVGASRLFILPSGVGFEITSDGVLTRNGQKVAGVGSTIEAGGGIVKGRWLAPQVKPTLPDACITSRAWLPRLKSDR